jgi:energy-coupling factor transport system ATP-binding protein
MKINVSNLHFSYPGQIKALSGLNISIDTGELVAIVGQNGAGKTTLVKHFNGLLIPSDGKVMIGDWDTKEHTVAKLSARVGYVFQNPDEQLFKRNIYDEISFGPKNLGFSEQQIESNVEDAIQLTDLHNFRDSNPYDLSPTWRKMVAIASIIAMDTPIVILDEPTTGQDAVNIERIAHIVDTLHKRGKTVITISHDIDFCAENFERIIALSMGIVLLDGATREVISEVNILSTTYVDPPQLTRLALRLGFPTTVTNQAEFLDELQKMVEK